MLHELMNALSASHQEHQHSDKHTASILLWCGSNHVHISGESLQFAYKESPKSCVCVCVCLDAPSTVGNKLSCWCVSSYTLHRIYHLSLEVSRVHSLDADTRPLEYLVFVHRLCGELVGQGDNLTIPSPVWGVGWTRRQLNNPITA